MPPEDVNRLNSRTQLNDADGRPRIPKSLIHSLLGLPENTKGLLRCQASVPPVSFRYGSDLAAIMAQPGATSFALPDITANTPRDNAIPPAASSPSSKDTSQTRSILNEPDKAAALSRANQQNENQHVLLQENNKQAADKLSLQHQQSMQESSKKETLADAASPPAAPLFHRRITKPEKREAKGGNFKKDHEPALHSHNHQAAAKADAQTIRHKEELTIPGFSPEKRIFPLLSSLMDKTLAGSEKPSAARLTASDDSNPEAAPIGFYAKERSPHRRPAAKKSILSEAKQKDVTFTRHFHQAPSEDKIRRNSAVAPGSNNHDALQEEKRHAPLANIDIVPFVVAGHRQAEKHGTVAPVPGADGEDFHRLEQLGRSFQQLLAKKLAGQKQKDDQPRKEVSKKMQKPTVQHVVVIQRNDARPHQERTAAFWERSYLGRSRLNIIR